jgi:MFS transporter, DHA1 family, multidrug resistance protein
MYDLIRDAPFGQIIRYISGNRVLLYPEERPDFELPKSYTENDNSANVSAGASGLSTPGGDEELGLIQQQRSQQAVDMEKIVSTPIVPGKLKDGTILVDWYTVDDPANPQHWSSKKKAFTAFQIWYDLHSSKLIKVSIHLLSTLGLPFTRQAKGENTITIPC